jgi:hypothetical protein
MQVVYRRCGGLDLHEVHKDTGDGDSARVWR